MGGYKFYPLPRVSTIPRLIFSAAWKVRNWTKSMRCTIHWQSVVQEVDVNKREGKGSVESPYQMGTLHPYAIYMGRSAECDLSESKF